MKHEKIRAALAAMPIRNHWFHHHPGGSHHLLGGYISESVNRVDPAICHIPATEGIAAARANAAFIAACNPAAIAALLEERDALIEALETARQFIVNGIELGYIQMPDTGTPDSANRTLPALEDALAAYRSGGEQ